NCDFIVDSFDNWQMTIPLLKPKAFIYLRVEPELMLKKCVSHNTTTPEQIIRLHEAHESFFIKKATISAELKNIPVLVLNGTIDFETDFSQFYTHLFSIKKFFKELKDQEAKEQGTYVAPKKKHAGCKC